MAGRRFYRKFRKALRRYRKRLNKRRRYRKAISRPVYFGLPNRYVTKLRYVDHVTLTLPVGGAAVSNSFRANDLYDPYSGAGGHQPMGFDMLSAHYDHFVVIGSKITVTPFALDGGDGGNVKACFWGLGLTDTGSELPGLTYSTIMENNNITRRLTRTGHTNNFAGMGSYSRPKKMYFSLKKFFHLKTSDDRQYWCSSVASPADQAFFEIWCVGDGTDSTQSTHTFAVQIEYIVRCCEPRMILTSD